MDNTDSQPNIEGGQAFQEIETDTRTNSFIFKLEPGKQFSPEQIEKIKKHAALRDLSPDYRYYDCKHIIFSLPDDSALYLYLQNEDECGPHLYLWEDLIEYFNENFDERPILRDAGIFTIFDDEIIGPDASDTILDEEIYIREDIPEDIFIIEDIMGKLHINEEITREDCYACRDIIENMNIGINIHK